jgi:AcrR family transcriptional regulator
VSTTARKPRSRAAPPRRTQAERREGTIRKLLDAATDTLIDVGYAGATVQAICARAGVSQGGLFRHFPTREALIAAVGADVGRSILADFRAKFDASRKKEEPLALAIRLLREQCRSRPNQAWYELAMAARTNETLRRALEPVALQYYADIEALAREVSPELALRFGKDFSLMVQTVIAIFDGERLHGFVVGDDRTGDRRLDLVEAFIRTLAR